MLLLAILLPLIAVLVDGSPLSPRWTAGCYTSSPLPVDSTGHLNRTLPSGRTYLLHVPADYKPGAPHPVVLSFHGGMLRGISLVSNF